jgi:hypothetical protein
LEWGPKPTDRIESVRTGWPSIAAWGETGEIVVSHNFPTELVISHRETKGSGAWTEESYVGPGGGVQPAWSRVATSGETNNYLHMVYNTYNAYQGQETAILYSRLNKDTQEWDIQDELLEGTGSDFYTAINSDNYVLTTKGNTVIIMGVSAWFDLFYLRSDDNGETWEKTIIWEHPYPFFDLNTSLMSDTLYSVDNSANVAIDNTGMVHVVWGIGRVARLASSPPDPGNYSYWPFTDGIGYWNESMGQIPNASNVHHTLNPDYLESLGMLVGWTQDVNGSGFVFDFEGTAVTPFAVYRSLGISTMPSITIDANGAVVLAFASATETFVTLNGLYNYHHIWCRASSDLGNTWGNFYDLQADNIFHLYDECIYPVFAPIANPNGGFHLIYNADIQPGIFIDEDEQTEPTINRVIHNLITYEELGITGVLAAPMNLAGSVNSNDVYLQWQPPSGKRELYGYNVYRNDIKINTATILSTIYSDLNVSVGIYNYNVTAVYEEGESVPSNTFTVEISDPSSYYFETAWQTPYNPMTFYILEANIDDFPMQAGDEIGLFDVDPISGDQICVGAGMLTESLGGGIYLEMIASMDDGSNPDQANGFTPGNPIMYRLWNETTDEITTVAANYPYPGYDEVYTSQGSAMVELNGVTSITQELPLQTGWNLMSFRIMPENWDMLHIVQPLIDQEVLFKVLDESGGSIFHLPFPPPNGQWTNTIGDMANTEGYYVKLTDDAVFDLVGYPVETPMDIPLSQGWNIISYPCENPQNALDAVQPLIDAGVLFKVIDEAGGSIFHLPFPPPNGQWTNTIGNLHSGKGYYLRVTQDAVFTISEPDKAAVPITDTDNSNSTNYFQPVWENNPYMPMHIVIQPDEQLKEGDEIGVFDGNICVGAATYDGDASKPIIIITSMDDPYNEAIDGFVKDASIEIIIWNNVSGGMTYVDHNAVSGSSVFEPLSTLVAELLWTYTGANQISSNELYMKASPNPFDEKIQINFTLPDNGLVKIECFDILGIKVKSTFEQYMLQGNHNISFLMHDLEKGVYLLWITFIQKSEKSQKIIKIIKK